MITTIVYDRFVIHRETFSVSVRRLVSEPVISGIYNGNNDNSEFIFNSRPTYFPRRDNNGNDTLLVQVDSLKPQPETIYDLSPANIVMTRRQDTFGDDVSDENRPVFSLINAQSIVVAGSPCDNDEVRCGAREPRVTYVSHLETYFMFYTTSAEKTNGIAYRTLAKASWENGDYTSWSAETILFQSNMDYKSAALHYNASDPLSSRLLFSDHQGIVMAQVNNTAFTDWRVLPSTKKYLIQTRVGSFDDYAIKPAANPVSFNSSDGRQLFLMLYNADIENYSSHTPRPSYSKGTVIGYVIYDTEFNEVFRSGRSIMSPELDWERCDLKSVSPHGTGNVLGLEPNTLFINGMKQLVNEHNQFLVYYAGC
eukprot:CAMPEP_0117420486 /NCGR_PEP_ID=MMETSP0758-20121206/1807_1 /TAXON_ID=63605 /ORGANISM="Percolomonas cosmopolitus, Strain AE-1 (ATCC 50343)" /LENGTH=366 /DNA_ID=CAMNT_0005202117 /DNA_START=94 /DNA_END=1191 /DNA_ORIENTATION=-